MSAAPKPVSLSSYSQLVSTSMEQSHVDDREAEQSELGPNTSTHGGSATIISAKDQSKAGLQPVSAWVAMTRLST